MGSSFQCGAMLNFSCKKVIAIGKVKFLIFDRVMNFLEHYPLKSEILVSFKATGGVELPCIINYAQLCESEFSIQATTPKCFYTKSYSSRKSQNFYLLNVVWKLFNFSRKLPC